MRAIAVLPCYGSAVVRILSVTHRQRHSVEIIYSCAMTSFSPFFVLHRNNREVTRAALQHQEDLSQVHELLATSNSDNAAY